MTTKMKLNSWQFPLPCRCSDMMWGALHNGAHPGLRECLRHLALSADIVIDIKFGGKHKNTNKTQGLASNYGTNQSLVVYEPQHGTSTQLINATSWVKM
jgi:hypothetical protein